MRNGVRRRNHGWARTQRTFQVQPSPPPRRCHCASSCSAQSGRLSFAPIEFRLREARRHKPGSSADRVRWNTDLRGRFAIPRWSLRSPLVERSPNGRDPPDGERYDESHGDLTRPSPLFEGAGASTDRRRRHHLGAHGRPNLKRFTAARRAMDQGELVDGSSSTQLQRRR